MQWCEQNGARHGPWKEWYSDGSLKSEGAYRAGKMSGEWTSYHDPSTLDEALAAPAKREIGSYERGVRVGVWTTFYPSGVKNRESKYSDGAANVAWTAWHESGAKWAIGASVGSVPHGGYTEWYPSGQMSAQGSYDHGAKVSWEQWDELGNPMVEGSAPDD